MVSSARSCRAVRSLIRPLAGERALVVWWPAAWRHSQPDRCAGLAYDDRKARCFFAVQNVASGPKRRLVRRSDSVAIGVEADMTWTP
jgi:hypothetical protein